MTMKGMFLFLNALFTFEEKKFSEGEKKTPNPHASLSFQRFLGCIFSILSFAKCNKIMYSGILKDLGISCVTLKKYRSNRCCLLFTATNFTLISSYISSPTFLQCRYRSCSTFRTLWAWRVCFPLLTIWAQSLWVIPHLQLHQHPKTETQPHVYCTGQFRWWFLCTTEASVTPWSRDLLWEGGHGVKLSMNCDLGNVCCVRKMRILMDGLMLLFPLPQATVTWKKADLTAKRHVLLIRRHHSKTYF